MAMGLAVARGRGTAQDIVLDQRCEDLVEILLARGFKPVVWPEGDVTTAVATRTLQRAEPPVYAKHKIDGARTGYLFWNGDGFTEIVCQGGRVTYWLLAGDLSVITDMDHPRWRLGTEPPP